MSLFCWSLIGVGILGGVFLFAVAIARAARDIEPVRPDAGEYGDHE
jgi:hypothetical protein